MVLNGALQELSESWGVPALRSGRGTETGEEAGQEQPEREVEPQEIVVSGDKFLASSFSSLGPTCVEGPQDHPQIH